MLSFDIHGKKLMRRSCLRKVKYTKEELQNILNTVKYLADESEDVSLLKITFPEIAEDIDEYTASKSYATQEPTEPECSFEASI